MLQIMEMRYTTTARIFLRSSLAVVADTFAGILASHFLTQQLYIFGKPPAGTQLYWSRINKNDHANTPIRVPRLLYAFRSTVPWQLSLLLLLGC